MTCLAARLDNVNPKAEFLEMGIEDPALCNLFWDVGFDLVSLHAAQIDVRTSVADPARDATVNVLGMLNVLECARERGTRRIVYVSSGGVVYGEPEEIPTPEGAPKLPLSPYGVTKLSGEYYLHYYQAVHGLEYVVLRYANVFGPRQDPYGEAGVVAIFCERLQSGEELTIFGDGEQTRDYVYVKDVVSANLLVSEMVLTPAPNIDAVAFNVGTGVGTSVNRLADVLESIAEDRPGRVYREARVGELRHSTLDVSRLAERGWAAGYTLKDGLRETFHFIASQKIGA